jgi:hypothetical protein
MGAGMNGLVKDLIVGLALGIIVIALVQLNSPLMRDALVVGLFFAAILHIIRRVKAKKSPPPSA